MVINDELTMFALGAMGALSVEMIKAYELRGKLHLKKYQKMYKTPIFWGVVVGMCFASGFLAWAVNASADGGTPWQIVIAGIGANSFVRRALEAKNANSGLELGEEQSDLSVKDLFS